MGVLARDDDDIRAAYASSAAPPLMSVAKIQPTRTIVGSTPKCSPSPPETPATYLSVEDRVRRLVVFMGCTIAPRALVHHWE